jgi:hypothetical protein
MCIAYTVSKIFQLTDDFKVNGTAPLRGGGNLTLVKARVAQVNVLDPQRPRGMVRLVNGPETSIGYERRVVDGEDVLVPVPDPGNLRKAEQQKGFSDQHTSCYPPRQGHVISPNFLSRWPIYTLAPLFLRKSSYIRSAHCTNYFLERFK